MTYYRYVTTRGQQTKKKKNYGWIPRDQTCKSSIKNRLPEHHRDLEESIERAADAMVAKGYGQVRFDVEIW